VDELLIVGLFGRSGCLAGGPDGRVVEQVVIRVLVVSEPGLDGECWPVSRSVAAPVADGPGGVVDVAWVDASEPGVQRGRVGHVSPEVGGAYIGSVVAASSRTVFGRAVQSWSVTETTVTFGTDGVDGDERLIRAYVLPAMERLPEREDCTDVGFLRYGHAPESAGGEVRLHLAGDVDALIEAESGRWDELVTEGLATDWEVTPEDDSETFGPTGAETVAELQFLSSRMSKHVFEEFDEGERLAPVDEHPDEGPVPAGWWTLLHFLADQQTYTAAEEIDAYTEGIRNRLWRIGSVEGADAANARIDDLQDKLEEVREEVDRMTEE